MPPAAATRRPAAEVRRPRPAAAASPPVAAGPGAAAFELAQPRIEVDVEVALALLLLLLLVDQHLDLPAQTCATSALQLLDLAEELDQTLALQLLLERGDAVVELLLDLRQPLVGGLDPLARLVVVEERGARGERDEHSGERERRERAAGAGQTCSLSLFYSPT